EGWIPPPDRPSFPTDRSPGGSVGIASQPLWLYWTDEGGPCFCRISLADQVHRVLARMALLHSTGGYLVGPYPEAGQCGGTEGVAEGDVGCVAAARDQDPADARRVVARVEGVPLPAE